MQNDKNINPDTDNIENSQEVSSAPEATQDDASTDEVINTEDESVQEAQSAESEEEPEVPTDSYDTASLGDDDDEEDYLADEEESDFYENDEDEYYFEDDSPAAEFRPGHAMLTIFLAVAIVVGLSWVPWGEVTNKYFKDFGLLSDLFPSLQEFESQDYIDPNLAALENSGLSYEAQKGPVAHGRQSESVEGKTGIEIKVDSLHVVDNIVVNSQPNRVSGEVVMEDYTADHTGLSRIKHALANASKRPVRIAIIGDSYIEGDIFSQDIRQQLQDTYGGRGVGYVPMRSEVAGFRRSVRHNSGDWTTHDIRKSGNTPYRTLPGEYFTGNAGSHATYTGVDRLRHVDRWNTSKLLFIAPADGSITIATDAGSKTYPVKASSKVQCITVDGNTSKMSVTNNVPGLIALGAWLSDNTGVTVDNMSLRGNSGITHRNLNANIAAQMRPYVDYDLIIIEYGINALQSTRTDYKFYTKAMLEVIASLRQNYPAADIILMGIGDRGQKQGSVVHSMSTAPSMVEAQREAAKRAQVVFWDTREAMGGNDAVVKWRENHYVNPDYIHLNHDGGGALATEFVKAFKKSL